MRRSGLTWTTVGLVVLAVAAIVLAFAALRSTRGSGSPTSLASALPNPSDGSSQAGKDNGGSLGDGLPDVIEPPLLLVNPTLAYRARTGTCLGGSDLERSTDGGVKWKSVTSPAPAIVSMSSTGGDDLTVMGAGSKCTVRVWTSSDRGTSWSPPAAASDVFARDPSDPAQLSTPTGTVDNPCKQRSVAPISIDSISSVDAAVLCASGDLEITQDGGATWVKQQPVAGGQAMSFESPELGWVLRANSGQCPAYQLMHTQDAGLTWQTGGCVGTAPIADHRQYPSLSFADPTNGMADLAGEVYVTDDSGLTWHQAS
jgi:photosystem II stability/assembly factor-like uncharacterized protein